MPLHEVRRPPRGFARVDTIVLRVRDVEASASWYTHALGAREVFADRAERLVVLGLAGETTITLWQLKSGEELRQGPVPAAFPILASSNAAADRDALEALGVDVAPMVESENMRFFAFKDPDGNHIEVCEVREATA